MVEYHHPVIRNGTVSRPCPPLLFQTCSEVGEERDEFSPLEFNLPEEARPENFFLFFFIFFLYIFLNYMCNTYTNMYNYLHMYKSPLGTSLLVDLLSSHNRSKMVEL